MKLVNAHLRSKKHKTFAVPDGALFNILRVGDYVKVSNGFQRFWVKIKSIRPFTGAIANKLADTRYKLGDEISFRASNIHDIQFNKRTADFLKKYYSYCRRHRYTKKFVMDNLLAAYKSKSKTFSL